MHYPSANADDAALQRIGLASMAEMCGFEGGGSQYRALFSMLDVVHDLYYAARFEEPNRVVVTDQNVNDALALVERVYAWILSELTEEEAPE